MYSPNTECAIVQPVGSCTLAATKIESIAEPAEGIPVFAWMGATAAAPSIAITISTSLSEIVKGLSAQLGTLSAVSQQSILQVMGGMSHVTAHFSAAAGILGAVGGLALAWAALSGLMAERRREIGVMKAVGWRTCDIVRTFVSESAILGISGGILGTAVGLVLALSLPGLPAPVPSLQQPIAELSAAPVQAAVMTLPIEISPAMLLTALLIAVAGGILTSWLGAHKTANLKTARVLRDD